MRTRKNWPVNWVDGMKINKSHFILQDDNLREQLEIVTAFHLTEFNYGHVEREIDPSAQDLIITSERVELLSCRAVTQGGHYIEINETNKARLEEPVSELLLGEQYSEADIFTILVRINTERKDFLGEPDSKETPLRHPYAASSLRLEIIPSDNIFTSTAYHDAIPVAQVVRKYQSLERIKDYIPPLARLNANTDLLQAHNGWKQRIVETENFLYEIVRKINDKHIHGNHNSLSQDLLNLTSAVLRYLSDNYDRFSQLLPSEAPIHTVLWFMGLARVILSEMRLAANSDNLEKYIAFFVNQKERYHLLQVSMQLKDFRYDHGDIRAAKATIDQFLSSINYLFSQLRTLQYNEIADPTIINSMRTGNIMGGPNTGGRINVSQRPAVQQPPPQSAPTQVTGGNRKISIRRSNRNLTDPPASTGESGNVWDLDD